VHFIPADNHNTKFASTQEQSIKQKEGKRIPLLQDIQKIRDNNHMHDLRCQIFDYSESTSI